jgi:outer membrane protein
VLAVGFVVLVLAAVAPCAAQVEMAPVELEVPLVVGIGVGMIPDYEGSDEYTFGIAPFFRWTFWGERYIQLRANELSVNVLNSKYFQLGPLATYKFGRSDVDDDVVDRMEDIDDTVELGAFAAYVLRSQQNIRQRFIADVDFLHDVGGVSNSFRVSMGARYWHPVARRLDLMIGLRGTLVTDDYMNTYFGVSGDDAVRSGLPEFRADGGGKDIAVTLGSLFYLTENWVLSAGVKYSRLLGDAADSPIVDDRGSANQFIAGVGVGYMWGRPAGARP